MLYKWDQYSFKGGYMFSKPDLAILSIAARLQCFPYPYSLIKKR
jgi:hypothetical protein